MRVSRRERVILRMLGYKCCVTCRYFDDETRECKAPIEDINTDLSPLFDLRKNIWLRKLFKDRLKRILYIGSGCPYWKGLRRDFLSKRGEDK